MASPLSIVQVSVNPSSLPLKEMEPNKGMWSEVCGFYRIGILCAVTVFGANPEVTYRTDTKEGHLRKSVPLSSTLGRRALCNIAAA